MPSTRRRWLRAVAALPVAASRVAARSTETEQPLPPGMAWSRSYHVDGSEHVWDALALDDGYLLVSAVGGERVKGGDGVVVRTDADGRERWRQRVCSDDPVTLGHVTRTDDGDFLVGGVHGDPADADALVLKVGVDGTEQWRTRFSGSFGPYEPVRAVELADGTVGLAATLTSLEDRWVWAGRYDPAADELRWSFEQDPSEAFRVVETLEPSRDEGFYVAGRDGWATGWLWRFGDDNEPTRRVSVDTPDAPRAVVRTPDGGFLFAGSGTSNGEAAFSGAGAGGASADGLGDQGDPWALRFGPDLDERWRDTYAAPSGYGRFATKDATVTRDGGFVVAGDTSDAGNEGAAVAFHLAPDGSLEWTAPYPRLRNDVVTTVVQDVGDGYVLAGETRPGNYETTAPSGGADGWLATVDQPSGPPRSPSPRPSPTETPSPTAPETPTGTPTDSPAGTPGPTGTTVPGFGVATAVVATVLGGLGAALRRRRDGK